jgi:hypothetical protein
MPLIERQRHQLLERVQPGRALVAWAAETLA